MQLKFYFVFSAEENEGFCSQLVIRYLLINPLAKPDWFSIVNYFFFPCGFAK